MKNKITLKLCCIFVAGSISINNANAQKIAAGKVPAIVKENFKQTFPGVTTIQWELEDNHYEAGFKQDGKTMSALIDKAGTLLETETDIAVTELPASVTTYIASHYNNVKIKEAAIIKNAAGTVNYEAAINHKDLLFNTKGEFIKAVKD